LKNSGESINGHKKRKKANDKMEGNGAGQLRLLKGAGDMSPMIEKPP
jgi:hypothetical protein